MANKPPTQTFKAQGIAAIPITMNEPEDPVDWFTISRLSPFQLFIAENLPYEVDDSKTDARVWAEAAAKRQAAAIGDQALLEHYFTWFEEQGKWPDETPYGTLK